MNLTNKEAYSPPNSLAWDGAPGGTQSVSSQAGSRVPSVDISFGPFFNLSFGATFAGDFCFVPAVSALDVTNLDPPALQKAYTGGISPTNPARVNNFIAQERIAGTNVYNQAHPRLTPRNAQWVFNEIQNISNTLNCVSSYTIDYGASVTGGGLVCTCTVFSISNNIYSLPVTWSSSNPAGLSINPTTGVATRINNYNGPATVTASISGGCGAVTLPPFNVWVGAPILTGGTASSSNIWLDNTSTNPDFWWNNVSLGNHTLFVYRYGKDANGANTTVNLKNTRKNGTLTYTPVFGSSTADVAQYAWFVVKQGDTYTIEVSTSNACGSLNRTAVVTTTSNPSPYRVAAASGSTGLNAYPNPSSATLTIEPEAGAMPAEFTAALFTRYGEQVKSGQSKEGKLSMETLTLPDGLYVLKLNRQGEIITKQIAIKH